ncbi:MAG: hypothetical protein HY689_14945 [Chloroflexi bacterium]|nr:hypothetical protein [Chloroflexota bacterium]
MERERFGLPKLELPPEPPITVEEIERRKKVGKELDKLREEIGPLGITWEELDTEEDEDG